MKGSEVWYGAPQYCYAYQITPPPPAGNPMWRGHDPSEGSVWTCDQTTGLAGSWFVPNGKTTIDPAQVARTLEDRAPFAYANANIAPPPTLHTYVRYVNWLWVDPGQWKDVSVSVSIGGATVGLTASPKYTTWTMGNGDTITCNGPGQVWQNGLPDDAPTDCSYAYEHMSNPNGDQWTISAQITYGISWTCRGACGGKATGDLADVTAKAGNSTSIKVYQRRTVITE